MTSRNSYSVLTLVTVIGMAIYISGCSSLTLGNNLAQDDAVTVELLAQTKGVSVRSANVYEKNDKLAVYGSLTRSSDSQRRFREHVDINVIGPDNKLLAAKTVQTRPVNPHPNVRTVGFTAYLDIVPPPGSVVQVAAHKGMHL